MRREQRMLCCAAYPTALTCRLPQALPLMQCYCTYVAFAQGLFWLMFCCRISLFLSSLVYVLFIISVEPYLKSVFFVSSYLSPFWCIFFISPNFFDEFRQWQLQKDLQQLYCGLLNLYVDCVVFVTLSSVVLVQLQYTSNVRVRVTNFFLQVYLSSCAPDSSVIGKYSAIVRD